MNPILIKKVKRHIISPKIYLIMKISLLLLICCVSSAFSITSYSQTANLSLSMRDVSVEDVLNKIEDQSEFRFLYNKKLVDVNRKVSISSKQENISDILKII